MSCYEHTSTSLFAAIFASMVSRRLLIGLMMSTCIIILWDEGALKIDRFNWSITVSNTISSSNIVKIIVVLLYPGVINLKSNLSKKSDVVFLFHCIFNSSQTSKSSLVIISRVHSGIASQSFLKQFYVIIDTVAC